jgi:hypothetical protein
MEARSSRGFDGRASCSCTVYARPRYFNNTIFFDSTTAPAVRR